jgi:hypothetical protein
VFVVALKKPAEEKKKAPPSPDKKGEKQTADDKKKAEEKKAEVSEPVVIFLTCLCTCICSRGLLLCSCEIVDASALLYLDGSTVFMLDILCLNISCNVFVLDRTRRPRRRRPRLVNLL